MVALPSGLQKVPWLKAGVGVCGGSARVSVLVCRTMTNRMIIDEGSSFDNRRISLVWPSDC